MLIVVWHHKETGDRWVTAESDEEAEARFNEAVAAGAYTASICAVLKSTDYPTVIPTRSVASDAES